MRNAPHMGMPPMRESASSSADGGSVGLSALSGLGSGITTFSLSQKRSKHIAMPFSNASHIGSAYRVSNGSVFSGGHVST